MADSDSGGTLEKSPKRIGQICQVHGPVVDVRFPQEGGVPAIFSALSVQDSVTQAGLALEVQCHLGQGVARTLAIESTEGLTLEMEVVDSGASITVPVGAATLGRLFNSLGEPIDRLGPIETDLRRPIHRPAPAFEDQIAPGKILETGIKAIDLLSPFVKGGKNCLLGGAGV
ncbi:MAG: F0F1 ATP synthase subunit beta, partial [Proteobacteria bacterium]